MWMWEWGGLKQCDGVVVRLRGDEVWFVGGTIVGGVRRCVGSVADRV